MSSPTRAHAPIDLAILYFGTPVVLVSSTIPDGSAKLAPMSSAWWLGRSCLLGFGARSQTPRNIQRTGECVLNVPSADEAAAVPASARSRHPSRPRDAPSKSPPLARHWIERDVPALRRTPSPHPTPMHYTLLIYQTADDFSARTDPAKHGAFWGAFLPYVQALREAGIVVAGAGLEPPAAGATVRLGDGRRQVQDGPYADTKEQLGGFFILDLPDLDTALDWAARCPVGAAVEVRPNLPPR